MLLGQVGNHLGFNDGDDDDGDGDDDVKVQSPLSAGQSKTPRSPQWQKLRNSRNAFNHRWMIDNDDNDRNVTFIYLWSLTGETMPWLLQSQELGAAEVEVE